MRTKALLIKGGWLLSSLLMWSCIDNNYDLSDIDTTVKFQVKELTVPINLDTLTLDQVMDLDDDSEIVKDFDHNGKPIYAIKKDGSFNSDDISVAAFVIPQPMMNPVEATLPFSDKLSSDFPDLSEAIPDFEVVVGGYVIVPDELPGIPFSSTTENIDDAIHSIDDVGVTTTFTATFQTKGLVNFAKNTSLVNLILQMPEGLFGSFEYKGKKYPIDQNGVLDLTGVEIDPNSKGDFVFTFGIDFIDAKKANIEIYYDNHSLTFENEIKVLDGVIVLKNTAASSLPKEIGFVFQPELDDIYVNSFSGEFEYNIKDLNISPIDLSSLPDFLNQTGTKIRLEFPHIYLSIMNPLNKYGIGFKSGLEMTAVNGEATWSTEPDGGQLIELTATSQDSDGNYLPNNILLVPDTLKHYYEGYTNLDVIGFSGLKDILAETGESIPRSIEVSLIDPKMPIQMVNGFHLGEDLDAVEGSYTFYAPLQLSDGSVIAYTDTIDGWNDEDVDAITISKVVLEFDATTDLPYEVILSIVPINAKAAEIAKCEPITLKANAKDEPVQLIIDGEIKHLDGIKIKAKVTSQSTDAMSPDMNLIVKNSKLTLTGYYEKEL